MTKEMRQEFDKLIEMIRKYPKGYEFTINYSSIPTRAKYNGMRFLLDEAEKLGLIECISIGLSFESMRGETWCNANEATFRRV